MFFAAHHHQRDVVQGGGTVVEGHQHVLRHGHLAHTLEYNGCVRGVSTDLGNAVVDLLGGMLEVLEVPIQLQSALDFHDALEVVGVGVLELPGFKKDLKRCVAGVVAHHVAQLCQQGLAFGVGAHAVGAVGVVVVGVGDECFFLAAQGLINVAAVGAPVGVALVRVGEQAGHGLRGGKRGKALVHPFVQALVEPEHAVVPAVCAFVYGHTYQAWQRAFTGDQGAHGVLHAAVTALYDRVLRVRVLAKSLVHVFEGLDSEFRKLLPILGDLLVVLVDEVHYRTVVQGGGGVLEVRIGAPSKVMHVFGLEFPGELAVHLFALDLALIDVAVSDFLGVLQHAGATYQVIFIDGDVHAEVAPHPIKLAADVRIGVPAFVVVFAHFGVPLGHGEFHALLVVPP